jgi:Family of unknown function (DUF5947)
MTRPQSGLSRFVQGTGQPPAAEPQATAAEPQATAGTTAGREAHVGGSGGSSPRASTEHCEMCAERIPAEHSHVADLQNSSLMCACRACYLLFTQPQAGLPHTQASTRPGRGRYRAIPDRYLHDPVHPMSAREWEELEIPVGLAFFLRSSQRDEVGAFYPSPAGATECRLDLAAWAQLSAEHPLLQAMEPDVEATLISRTDDTVEHFLVPIDACYELAGRMRLYWRGFDGGAEARESIAAFLDSVRSRARFLPRPDRADRGPAH